MKNTLLCLLYLLVIQSTLLGQVWKESLVKTDSLIKAIETINIYVETRFQNEFRGTGPQIVGDSISFSFNGINKKIHGKDLKLVYFFKPDLYNKWIGAVGGVLGAVGTLYLIDYYFNTFGYKFGITEYSIASLVGGVVGYMIGRGIGSEKIEIDFRY